MRRNAALLFLWLLVLALPQPGKLWAQDQKKDALPELKLKVGEMAPDFTLPDTKGNKVQLSSFRGKKNVVLAFYIFAFTGG